MPSSETFTLIKSLSNRRSRLTPAQAERLDALREALAITTGGSERLRAVDDLVALMIEVGGGK